MPNCPHPYNARCDDAAIQPGDPERCSICLRAEVERLKADYAAEVAEFNAGYQAGKEGKGLDAEPPETPHDVWRAGYAWGAFDGLFRAVRAAKGE